MSKLLTITARLDSLRERCQPSKAEAKALVAMWTTGAAATYFFRDYSNPTWLQPLAEVGAFQRYARTRAGKLRRWVIFRELAAYLNRVAKAEPKQVADILASLSTSDLWVTGQFMKATLALPDEQAARVVPQFAKWCRQGNPFARDEEVTQLAQRMLDSDHLHEFQLFLGFLLNPVSETSGHISGLFFDDDLIMFVRDGKVYAAFCDSAPFECLGVAEKSLRRAIRLKAQAPDPFESLRGGKRADPSSGMRSAIEENEQNRYPHFEDGLVVAVREALAACVKESRAEAKKTIRRYLHSNWSLLRRLAIHTLTENAGAYPELAKSAALRRRFFKDTDLHHEYWRLVPAVFDDLSSGQKARLLRWIDAAYEGADEQDKQWFAHRRLTMLAECDLPPAARRRFQELQTKLPEPEHADFLVYSQSWAGAVSRELPADLEKMTIDDLYKFLDTWRPDPDKASPFGPSYQRVGGDLSRLAKADPGRYKPLVLKMTKRIDGWMASGTDQHWATYVWSLLSGYRDACRDGEPLDWSAVLDLLDRAVPGDTPPSEWPDALPPSGEDQARDAGWRGVRGNAANLLAEGINPKKAAAIPDCQLPRVRDILIRLTRDPFPTPEDEQKREQKTADTPNAAPVDWYHFAIGTNRPETANVLLRYAVRHARTIAKEGREKRRVEPDVCDALGALADDPCRSVHAMLGSWLGVLWWLDDEWLQGLMDSLLPPGPEKADLWEAGWVSFLQYGTLYLDLHKHLVPHYERSIKECASRSEHDQHLKGLCKHLAPIHAWGLDEVPEADSLLSRFYEAVEDDAASELADAFGQLARRLDEAGEDAPSYWQRIESLIRWRLEQIGPNAQCHTIELRSFASWLDLFIERSASDLDAMAEVLEVVTSVRLLRWQFARVVEFLDAQVQAHPKTASRLLRRMLSVCDRQAWHPELDKMTSILEKVFASDDADAHRDAVKVVEHLWEEGEWKPFEQHKSEIARLAKRS